MSDRYLFLDDERKPGDVTWCELPSAKYAVVRNYDEFVRHVITFGVPKFVAFDHDLADFHYRVMAAEAASFTFDDGDLKKTFDYGPEKTGYDCAKWLVEFCEERGLKFPDYTIHSLNPIGKLRISNYIDNAKQHLNI